MLCQLSYAVRSVRVLDISELSLSSFDIIYLVPSFLRSFLCVGVMYSGEYDVCDVTLSACISTPGKLEKYVWPRWEY